MEFAAAGWYIGKYLRLDRTIKDLSCGDSKNLFVVIRLEATGLEQTGLVCFQDFWKVEGKRSDGVVWFSVWSDWVNRGCVDVWVVW